MAIPAGLFGLLDNVVRHFLPSKAIPGAASPGLLALAAVLVHIARADGVIVKSEHDYVISLLVERFGLLPAQAHALFDEAEAADRESIGLVALLRPLRRTLDRDERKRLIRAAWGVARIDGAVHAFEDDMIWRSARLLDLTEAEISALREQELAEPLVSLSTTRAN